MLEQCFPKVIKTQKLHENALCWKCNVSLSVYVSSYYSVAY